MRMEMVIIIKNLIINYKGDLSFVEFKAIFNNYDFCDMNNLTAHLIEEFREIILGYNINLKDIFEKIDK